MRAYRIESFGGVDSAQVIATTSSAVMARS